MGRLLWKVSARRGPPDLATGRLIFFTLTQGLALPTLIRRLGVSDRGADADGEIHARLVATTAALEDLDLEESRLEI